MRRVIPCAAFALVASLLGPRLVGPQPHAAGAPFVYEPPEGFVPSKSGKVGEADAQVWVFGGEDANAPRIVLHHSSHEMSVEEADLAKLASEMPAVFEGACTWTHRRHELRMQSDGARVGLIEGDCVHELSLGALGLPSQKTRSRKLQLMFPDDGGTTIVTASYPTEQAARWEPLFEATIGKARGVATRVPSPPAWVVLAWAAAGAVVGWLVTGLVAARSPRSSPPKRDREDDKVTT